MAKTDAKAERKIHKVMREKKEGTLRSSSGEKVTSRKQAIAIALSEARRAGGKVPPKSSSRSKSKKSSSRAKSTSKRSTSAK